MASSLCTVDFLQQLQVAARWVSVHADDYFIPDTARLPLATAVKSYPRCSSGILRERHRCGAGAVVSLDVDKRNRAAIDLPLSAVQSRANFIRVFDVFAITAERFGHLVETRIAKITTGLVALGVSGPASVEADPHQDRNVMAHRGVELECVEAKRAVAVDDDDLLVGLGDLRTDSERQSNAHGAEWSGIEPMAGRKGRHRLSAEVQYLLPVDH